MSGPRRHRPTGLHLRRPTAMVAALSRKRRRDPAVRTGEKDGPLRPVADEDPAADRAIEAARRLLDGGKTGQNP